MRSMDTPMNNGWSAMQPDILELISDRLPLVDFISFRGVCPSWRSAPSGRSEVSKFNKNSPWLMLCVADGDNDDYKCYVYCASRPTCCTFRLPDLKGATVVESKLGWLLAHRNGNFFFYNPFSLERIELAHHHLATDYACTFSAPPARSRCAVYIVNRTGNDTLEISRRRGMGNANWVKQQVDIRKHDHCDQRRILDVYSCTQGNLSLMVRCPTNTETYNFFNTKKICTYDGDVDHEPGFDCDHLLREFVARHGDDWLKRFERRAISISPIDRSASSVPDTHGTFGGILEIEGQGNDAEILKAAWIEPSLALHRVSIAALVLISIVFFLT